MAGIRKQPTRILRRAKREAASKRGWTDMVGQNYYRYSLDLSLSLTASHASHLLRT